MSGRDHRTGARSGWRRWRSPWQAPRERIDGVVVGQIVGFGDAGARRW
ncbi:MAG: hypothetical protein MZV65_48115 [Chromatiales bacterium]|nr:hypothetical protein [Chromatiales bacterium]